LTPSSHRTEPHRNPPQPSTVTRLPGGRRRSSSLRARPDRARSSRPRDLARCNEAAFIRTPETRMLQGSTLSSCELPRRLMFVRSPGRARVVGHAARGGVRDRAWRSGRRAHDAQHRGSVRTIVLRRSRDPSARLPRARRARPGPALRSDKRRTGGEGPDRRPSGGQRAAPRRAGGRRGPPAVATELLLQMGVGNHAATRMLSTHLAARLNVAVEHTAAVRQALTSDGAGATSSTAMMALRREIVPQGWP